MEDWHCLNVQRLEIVIIIIIIIIISVKYYIKLTWKYNLIIHLRTDCKDKLYKSTIHYWKLEL